MKLVDKKKLNSAGIATIPLIGIIILLIAIPLGVYLAQKAQIFKPKATAENKVVQMFVNSDGLNETWRTCDENLTSDSGIDGNCLPFQQAPLPQPSGQTVKYISYSVLDLGNGYYVQQLVADDKKTEWYRKCQADRSSLSGFAGSAQCETLKSSPLPESYVGTANRSYLSYAALNDGKGNIYQILLDAADGKTEWYRKCQADTTGNSGSGIASGCGVLLNGGQPRSDITARSLTVLNNGANVYMNLITSDGKQQYWRKCGFAPGSDSGIGSPCTNLGPVGLPSGSPYLSYDTLPFVYNSQTVSPPPGGGGGGSSNSADCQITDGPTSLTVGQRGTYTAHFSAFSGGNQLMPPNGPFGEIDVYKSDNLNLSSALYNLTGGAFKYMDHNQNGTIGSEDAASDGGIDFTPDAPGTYIVSCRASNNSNTECRSSGVTPQVQAVCSSGSTKQVTVTPSSTAPSIAPSVNPSASTTLTVSCKANPPTVNVGDQVQWQSTATGGDNSKYSFSWPGGTLNGTTGQNVTQNYNSPGTKTETVYVTDGTQTAQSNCSVNVNQVSVAPSVSASINPSGNVGIGGGGGSGSTAPSAAGNPVVSLRFDTDSATNVVAVSPNPYAYKNVDITLPIRINTQLTSTNYNVSTINTTIQYDPSKFKFVSLNVSPNVGFNSTCSGIASDGSICIITSNTDNGTVQLQTSIPSGSVGVSGSPIVANLKLTPINTVTGSTINFQNTSMTAGTDQIPLENISKPPLTLDVKDSSSLNKVVSLRFDNTKVPFATQGENIDLPIVLNTAISPSGTIYNVTSVNFTVSYDSNKFDYVNLSVEGNSGFNTNCTRSGVVCQILPIPGNHTVKLVTSIPTGGGVVAGEQTIATLTLKGKNIAAAGKNDLSFPDVTVTADTGLPLGVDAQPLSLEVKQKTYTATYQICEVNGDVDESQAPSSTDPACQSAQPYKFYRSTNQVIAKDFAIQDINPGLKSIFVRFTDTGGQSTVSRVLINYQPNPSLDVNKNPNSQIICSFVGKGMQAVIYGTNFYPKGGGSAIKINGQAAQISEWTDQNVTPPNFSPPPVSTTSAVASASASPSSSPGSSSTAKLWRITAQIPQSSSDNVPVEIDSDGHGSVTGSCQVGVTTLDFSIKSQCGPQQNSLTDNVQASVYEDLPNAQPLVKTKISLDGDGHPQNFTPPALQQNRNYVIVVKGPKTTARAIKFTTNQGTTDVGEIDIPTGDIFPLNNPDGKINSFDKAELFREWSSSVDVTKTGDFNGDNRVNVLDWSCMRENFNKENETFQSKQ